MQRRAAGRLLARLRSLSEAAEAGSGPQAGRRLHAALPGAPCALRDREQASAPLLAALDAARPWQLRGRGWASGPEASEEDGELSERDYHRLADLALGELMVKLEALLEGLPDLTDADLEYQQGVLTLNLGSHGTYVINKQAPNKQIWMSSPVSGPVRYDCVGGLWTYKHDGHIFQERLAAELQQLTGREGVDLEPEPAATKAFAGYGADPT